MYHMAMSSRKAAGGDDYIHGLRSAWSDLLCIVNKWRMITRWPQSSNAIYWSAVCRCVHLQILSGVQSRLKSWGGPRFGSQHQGACVTSVSCFVIGSSERSRRIFKSKTMKTASCKDATTSNRSIVDSSSKKADWTADDPGQYLIRQSQKTAQ